MDFVVQPSDVPLHALEIESETLRRRLRMGTEIHKAGIEEVRRILGPIEPNSIDVRILCQKIANQSMFVPDNFRTRK